MQYLYIADDTQVNIPSKCNTDVKVINICVTNEKTLLERKKPMISARKKNCNNLVTAQRKYRYLFWSKIK